MHIAACLQVYGILPLKSNDVLHESKAAHLYAWNKGRFCMNQNLIKTFTTVSVCYIITTEQVYYKKHADYTGNMWPSDQSHLTCSQKIYMFIICMKPHSVPMQAHAVSLLTNVNWFAFLGSYEVITSTVVQID